MGLASRRTLRRGGPPCLASRFGISAGDIVRYTPAVAEPPGTIRRPPRRARRRRLAAVLVAVFAASTVELHPDIHPWTDEAQNESVNLAARHAPAPHHFDPYGRTVVPHCPACLRSLQNRSVEPVPGTSLPHPSGFASRSPLPHPAPALAPRSHPVSRGPPVS